MTDSATVRVIEKPILQTKMALETLGEFGKELEIPCNVGGAPPPAVRYSINPNNNSLHINYMRREDSGMFQCSASNEAGYITGYTWLRVKSELF